MFHIKSAHVVIVVHLSHGRYLDTKLRWSVSPHPMSQHRRYKTSEPHLFRPCWISVAVFLDMYCHSVLVREIRVHRNHRITRIRYHSLRKTVSLTTYINSRDSQPNSLTAATFSVSVNPRIWADIYISSSQSQNWASRAICRLMSLHGIWSAASESQFDPEVGTRSRVIVYTPILFNRIQVRDLHTYSRNGDDPDHYLSAITVDSRRPSSSILIHIKVCTRHFRGVRSDFQVEQKPYIRWNIVRCPVVHSPSRVDRSYNLADLWMENVAGYGGKGRTNPFFFFPTQ